MQYIVVMSSRSEPVKLFFEVSFLALAFLNFSSMDVFGILDNLGQVITKYIGTIEQNEQNLPH